MNIEEKNGIKYLTFDLLKDKDVKYGFSTRIGGVSSGVYESMNLGFSRGDSDENVKENFRRMAEVLDMNYERMCLSKQTHTTNVRIIKEEDAGNGIVRPLPYDDVDGLITNVSDLPLVTFFADCIPLVMFDPKKRVIAAAHSGWRGTVGKIGKVTIDKMVENFGCDPKDILCCVGPGICRDCYEVSGDVAEEVKKAFGKELAEQYLLRPSVFHPRDREKYMLDLWKACEVVFLEAGISKENIEVTDYCTRCNPTLFYSHRIMGANRGNLASFISL
ncbi:MAG: peptidoglycan editing factor PgeF [Lachnospiraceae bacterium]|nr:peptidoglycan editing factor PgeF [Lachnospiraceae bacterium]